MANIHYIDYAGTERVVTVESGLSLMEGALAHGIPGIAADCGGVCSCATCHVYVDPAWIDQVGGAQGDENDLLDLVDGRQPTSRLSCQITVTEAMDGLVVRTPETQG